MDPPAARDNGLQSAEAEDRWPSLRYGLAFGVAGAALSLSISSTLNWGGHAQASGALGILLLTFLVSAAAAVVGAVAGMFQRVRLIGIALLSAGLGGLLSTIAFFTWRITR